MRRSQQRPPLGDGWFESEGLTRTGIIAELQRLKRRFRVRPLPVLLIAAAITAIVAHKFATKPRQYEARVVLALSEGSMSAQNDHQVPYEQLREYVSAILLSDARLTQLIEQRNLTPLRRKLGMQFAIDELRGLVQIEIWKNSFVYYDGINSNAAKSARIGLTVTAADPDFAFELAGDLASIAIKAHEEARAEVAEKLTRDIERARVAMDDRLKELSAETARKQAELVEAEQAGRDGVAGAIRIELVALANDTKRASEQFALINATPEAFADRVTAAKLDTSLQVVEERRPERHEQSGMVLAIIIAVIGTGALIGAALFVGAFDSRVHEIEDVSRLNLPVLGHVPGFPGDRVGSLKARGASRARVPLWLRWRSPR